MIITGIGSRQTPANKLEEMKIIGEWARANGHWIRSGHADGADWAFEQGAQEQCIVYLPWQGFNSYLQSKAFSRVPTFTERHFQLVDSYHPAPEKLSSGGRLLMARNACQVLGEKLDHPSDIVICWTGAGTFLGGTGQVLRIASDSGTAFVNLYHWSLDQTIKKLEELHGIR